MERRRLVDPKAPLSVSIQTQLLEVDRSSQYYKPLGVSEQNLALIRRIDELFLEDPTLGVLGMKDELWDLGLDFNEKLIRRLIRKMLLEPIEPNSKLSRLGVSRYIHSYQLRDCDISRPNGVWSIDITYIQMRSGFMI